MLSKLERKKGDQGSAEKVASNKPKRGEGEGASVAAKPKPRKILNILGAALKEDIKRSGKTPADQGNGDANAPTGPPPLNPEVVSLSFNA
jgi:hypothetical protein